MSKNFWATLPKPFFVLAPMEDVTDVVFRHVVKEAGAPDVFLQSLLIQIVIVILKGKTVCAGASFLQKMNSRWWHIFGEINRNFSVK